MKENITVLEDKDFVMTNDLGQEMGLINNNRSEYYESDSLQSLYPGQPEREDSSDETIPAGPEIVEGISKEITSERSKTQAQSSTEEEKNENTVRIPIFITAPQYILKRYRLMMYSYANQLLRKGKLSSIVGFPVKDRILNRNSLKIGFMTFWRIDRSNFYTDVSVRLNLDTGYGKKVWKGTLVLWCSFVGDNLTCSPEELIYGKPQRDGDWICLSPYLVPYLHNNEVDKVAEELLKKYLPEALNDPRNASGWKLAKNMGLTVKYLPVDKHDGIPSILFWDDGELPVRDNRRLGQLEPESVMVPKNTIVVNTNVIRREYAGHSICHECFHYPYHYMAYRLQKLVSNDEKKIKFKEVKKEEGKPIVNPLHFMEKQAGRGAYALTMPVTLTKEMINETYGLAEGCRHAGEVYDFVGREIAYKFFQPHFRVRTRMIQLGCIQAKGALNYVEKKPIKPFAFDPDAWRVDQHTFVIDPGTADNLKESNQDFCNLMTSGRYIYADGHIVRNTPKYVYLENGELLLTDWANRHVDECCLRFIRKFVQKSTGKFVLNRIYYDADYISQTLFYLEDIMEAEKLDEIDARYKYSHEFPRSFREAVNKLRKKKGIKMDELAGLLQISLRSLTRWLDDPAKNGGIDFVVMLCLILQLPDWISTILLRRAHIQLDDDDRRHQALQYILRALSNDGVDAANNFLREKNLEILSLMV